ncbi:MULTISPECIES: hypothetical protein [unclassified Chryseobacterium]|uniref:hypothetical protein n=1 Tax=unclassified Chryseobacterium TaxID=2593645 RepID=UPI00100BAF0F|nr:MULTISPECIES: hypothetical protein [unclassified Chryseobacterium]RXM50092.1 hypothetical protein BOQ64_20015 [Chryseobacterium sp. CH25]RXM66950.1 hypothetical protein BOQ60_03195 [Chryseobacterium sp. CH1]
MKKFLLTATMLVAFTALSKAQQGRVGINTTTPAATLDVVANAADASRPDALLIPRLTRAELETKNTAYADGNATASSAQNGALVFVTGLGGNGTGKTVNVTAPGFYYYDGTNGNNVWKTLGGSGVAKVPSIRTSATGTDLSANDLDGYVYISTNADLSSIPVSAATKGRTITLVKVGGPNPLTVNGMSANSVNSLGQNGRGLAFIYDGAAWQSYSAQ